MSTQLVIQGGRQLAGTIPVYGSKNAALPLLAATLLTDQEVTLHNIPQISDIYNLARILQSVGATVEQDGTTIRVRAENVSADKLSHELVGKLRGSILLLGAMLGRLQQMRLPEPGGDVIGARPLDAHLDGFRQLGATVTEADGFVTIDGRGMRAGEVVLREFSVTATENLMLAAARLPGTTTIYTAAAEPHVAALGELLIAMGARITGLGTHTITIEGQPDLSGAEFTNIQDMLEAGLFILIGAVTKSNITVTGVPVADLRLFFKKLDEIGVAYDIDGSNVHVKPAALSAFKMQVLPHPGVATDLQAPFAVLATQVNGASMIHDPLYESRFRHCDELQKMGAGVTVCDPHRVILHGPTPLAGREISSLDIRSGATLVMAGLVASGETVINDAHILDRGYANLVGRLQDLGAQIEQRGDMIEPIVELKPAS